MFWKDDRRRKSRNFWWIYGNSSQASECGIFTICSLLLLLTPYCVAAELQICMGCIKKSQTYDFTQQFLISMIIAKLSRCLASSINDIQLLRMKVKKWGAAINNRNTSYIRAVWTPVIRPVTLLKRDSNTGVFLWNLRNF